MPVWSRCGGREIGCQFKTLVAIHRHEIDFVLQAAQRRGTRNDLRSDPTGSPTRDIHPAGKNLVIATNVPKPYDRKIGGLTVTFTGLDDLAL